MIFRHWAEIGSGIVPDDYRRNEHKTRKYTFVFRKVGKPDILPPTRASEFPLETVSLLLGHRKLAITEKHYARFVPERQALIETKSGKRGHV
jgi:hypothetical protein